MNELKQSKSIENGFIKRLNDFCTIEKAIKSYSTGSTGVTQKNHTKQKRAEIKAYFIAFPEFKKRVDDILQLIKAEKRKPKDVVYNDGYKVEFDKVIYNLRRCGVPLKAIAKYLNVHRKTVIEWRKKHESFRNAWDKVKIDDLINTSNAVQRASKFYKTKTVRIEKGFVTGESGEPIPIDKTTTTITEHPPIMAAVKLKLSQANNGGLLGYIPPIDAEEKGTTIVVKHDASFITEADKNKLLFLEDEKKEETKE